MGLAWFFMFFEQRVNILMKQISYKEKEEPKKKEEKQPQEGLHVGCMGLYEQANKRMKQIEKGQKNMCRRRKGVYIIKTAFMF